MKTFVAPQNLNFPTVLQIKPNENLWVSHVISEIFLFHVSDSEIWILIAKKVYSNMIQLKTLPYSHTPRGKNQGNLTYQKRTSLLEMHLMTKFGYLLC